MAGPDTRSSGALVVSLDFELAWGVSRTTASRYAANLLGSRVAIPRLLALFEKYGIAATWATVGFLFARTRDELVASSPPDRARPRYDDSRLDPYREAIGENEEEDPFSYAPSLIDQIRQTPGQEVATHTFSHYYCAEPGQTAETFRADLEAARAIAERWAIDTTSIVFPRNQHNPAYDPILTELGISAYRGMPRAWMWRPGPSRQTGTLVRRAGRLADSYVSLSGHGTVAWSDVLQPNGLADVRASCFLRPVSPHIPLQRAFLLRRIRRSLRRAARRGEIYHLWWHPHNFGLHVDENLALLELILEEFARLREELGMWSLAMRDVDRIVRGAAAPSQGSERNSAAEGICESR
jgi:peptidoglycan/xylan/chitin deacetylase (PgdA/CDA1 family)